VTGVEVAVLKWIADLVKSLVASAGGDGLKKKKKLSSTERSSLLPRNLYVSLKELEEASKDFVEALTAIAQGESEAREPLHWALTRAAKASNKVAKAANVDSPFARWSSRPKLAVSASHRRYRPRHEKTTRPLVPGRGDGRLHLHPHRATGT